MPYSNGGIKYFVNFNETWPFIQYEMETVISKLIYNFLKFKTKIVECSNTITCNIN